MKIHLRFDTDSNSVHSKMTFFVDGKNVGRLTMSPDEADWFYLALERGCHELSKRAAIPLEFLGSGQHRNGEPIFVRAGFLTTNT